MVEKSNDFTDNYEEEESEQWGTPVNSYREIVLRCIEKCRKEKSKEELPKINEQIEELNQKYYEMYLKLEKHIPSREFAKNNLTMGTTPLGNSLIQDKEDERATLYRKMYQELLLNFKRENDLSNTIDIGLGDD